MTQKELYHAQKHNTSHAGNVGDGNVGAGTSAPEGNVGAGSSAPPPPPAPEPDPEPPGPIVSDERDEADYGSNPH